MYPHSRLIAVAAIQQTIGASGALLPARNEPVTPSHSLRSNPDAALPKRAPQDTTKPKPVNFAIQPNTGNGQADDCGRGPITLNAATWNDRKMDELINGIFTAGMPRENFDFHQEFADRYGVDFYCPNSFVNCQSMPSSCSSLTRGTVEEKEQGWLGIKAMMNVQEQFLQWEKVASTAIDSLSSLSTTFQDKFAPKQPGANLFAKGMLSGVFTVITVGGAALATTGVGVVPGAVLGSIGALGSMAVGIGFDSEDAKESPELSVLEISDFLPTMKQVVLTGLEGAHNATFSNGKAAGRTGATMKDLLTGGAYVGGEVVQAYVNGEQGLNGFYSRYMAIKLLEAFWQSQGAFFIYIPGVTGDCQKWHGNTGDKDVRRFCGEKGMMILASIDSKGQFGQLPGVSDDNVKSVGGYNIPLQSLYASTYNMYTGHGLEAYKDVPWHLNNAAKKYVVDNQPEEAYKNPGFFNLPVCEIKAWNWKQSDNMHRYPPCDCFCATDAWGHKFMDSELVGEPVKNWIRSKCNKCE